MTSSLSSLLPILVCHLSQVTLLLSIVCRNHLMSLNDLGLLGLQESLKNQLVRRHEYLSMFFVVIIVLPLHPTV